MDVDQVSEFLTRARFKVAAYHGGKSQDQRERALQQLKQGQAEVLICTDVAARGIDIFNVAMVINYHMPKDIVDYTHRIGRTGRAGKSGQAVTLIDDAMLKDDASICEDLAKYLKEHN